MDRMDDAVERVLRGLREVEPPPGMEGRMLRAMRDRATEAEARPWYRQRRRALSRAALALACMGAVAIAGSGLVTLLHHREAGKLAEHAGVGVGTTLVTSRPRQEASLHPAPAARSNAGQVVRSSPARVTLRRGPADPGLRPARAAGAMHAGERDQSFPAPPMPLTEQERLLLRIAHSGDPVELAMLNPEKRAAREAGTDADFQRFFNPKSTEANHENQP